MAGEEAVAEREKPEMVPLAEAGKHWREERATMAQWYVVEAVEGEDFEVCRQLSKYYDCWRPVDPVVVTRRIRIGGVMTARKIEKKIPRFGRYVFVRLIMTPSIQSAIKQSPEVKRWVCLAGTEQPASIPDVLIEFYQKGFEGEAKEIDGDFSPTDKVLISIGPATGVIGVVKSIANRAARLESRDGQWSGPLLVPLAHLELIEKGKGASLTQGAKAKKHAHV